jgi:heptosyltransferase II
MDPAKTDFRKIGLWQTAFLGDAVLTLPFIQALKARYPGAEIHLFVRAGLEDLFRAQRELASVRPFAKRGAQRGIFSAQKMGQELANEAFDLWISPHTSLRSAYMARCAGAPVRIGFDAPWYNWLAYTHLVPRRFDELEEIERLFQLGGPLGIAANQAHPAPLPHLDLAPEAIARADQIFTGLPTGPKLGIHPGSTWPTKCWPKEHFAEVARRALAAGAVVLLFAGPGEEALAADISQTVNDASGRFVNLANMLTIPALAACLGRLDACLTNDSGPMHLTWAQGVPLVACFGPTVRQLGFFPRGPNSRVLETPLDCRPCGLHGHKACPLNHHNCMRDISPDQVWGVLKPMLGV